MTATATNHTKPLYSRWCARPTCRRKVYRPDGDFCSRKCAVAEARRERQEPTNG